MICPRCQFTNGDDCRFCMKCGTPLTVKKESPFKKGLIATLKALAYVALFFAMQTGVMFCYTMLVTVGEMLAGGMSMDYYTLFNEVMALVYENIHIVMILSAGLTLLSLFLFFQLRHKNPLAEVHAKKTAVMPLIGALLLGAAAQVVVVVTIAFIPLPQSMIDEMNQNSELLMQGSPVLQFINIAIVTPILEEVIFRGLAFTRLRRGMRLWLAVTLSAVIFGIVHGTVVSFVYAGLLGALCALLMLRHGDSILPAILCHAGFNATSFLMAFVPDNSLVILAMYCVSLAATVALLFILFRKNDEEEAEAVHNG